ncbi:Splicing factor U2AF 50 kDa subunit [Morus notabilis]|uniref:Splicing factor U2AF 50 kDa subunit n=1 Tax=Morus notabilis TaxID=981085 RepID=W9QPG9_9ROSA|nr:splicing factor U2af large subunit B [Morus notabilis]XP_024018469.1 splicing factor U2af large subunit B [Morus notabilis]XP_024018471.1 splicing factor U2af large subunit B [Morus notabilis]EXB46745.1 Splicing factor U2AF 50 kDa subunit [Morus notabilis]
MSTSHRQKENNEKSRRPSLHNNDEGSAARTRPFSFEEIMLRRKGKSFSEDVKEKVVEEQIVSSENVVKSVAHCLGSERVYRHYTNSLPVAERHVVEEEKRGSFRKEEKKTSVSDKSEESRAKRKERGTRRLESKVEVVFSRPNNETRNEIKGGKNDKKMHDRRENDKRSTDNIQKEAGKRHSRDSRGKERHTKSSRGKSERESKRKYINGDDEKIKDRNPAKKLDTGRHHETDNSARNKRKEPSQYRFEEPRPKTERSRSRDHDRRSRRSKSPSLKDHKTASYDRMTYREVASHSHKDKSRKPHHADRNRLSSNGSSRRRDESPSALGGYSPRKRITEAAAKTPPPPDHSSEKKIAKWDVPPAGTDNVLSASVPSNFQSSNNIESTGVQELASAAPIASTFPQLPSAVPSIAVSTRSFASIDTVQLTQATRPMRRLYVENIPSSTSEKALVEWFNDLFLSSRVNHIQGTQPCISCIINKEKSQALVEFLTPEDASAALSFNGSSISGSVLKIRRPKDFVEVATGDLEKSTDAVDTISDVVKDSPNKIFIGGISKALSSKMLMEIVSAFGPLKAYHFEVNDELNDPCAFLEYVDQSIAPKACAGLNGMKLGGKVLTVIQAIRGAESLGNSAESSLYKIPEHAKPLLKQPTQVLKLKNMFNLVGFSSLSEPEVEEVIEDVRLECVRFGNVKSVNVVKQSNSQITSSGICELNNRAQTGEFGPNLGCEGNNAKTENFGGCTNGEPSGIAALEFVKNDQELKENEVPKDSGTDNRQLDNIIAEDKSCQTGQLTSDENEPNIIPEELPTQLNSPREVSEQLDDKVGSATPTDTHGMEKKITGEDNSTRGDTDSKKQGTVEEFDGFMETESNDKVMDDSKEQFDLGSIFEVGCVLVEFGRTEAACTAAHCLHGRLFDDRIVSVEYVALDHYKTRFPK